MADNYLEGTIETPVEVVVEIVGSGPQGKTGPRGPQGPPGDMDSSVYDPNGKKKDIFAHEVLKNNPHGVTLAQVGGSNPNLLDNWYFADPINQRGQTEYAKTGYSIDRWHISNNTLTLALVEGGCNLVMPKGHQFKQKFEDEFYKNLDGKYLTATILFSDNTIETGTILYGYDNVEWNNRVTFFLAKGFSLMFTKNHGFIFYSNDAVNCTIVAIKLELGSQQTLARQENGVWVLNDPPPNKQQELAKCQRYMTEIVPKYDKDYGIVGVGVFNGTMAVTIPLPTTMRQMPSVAVSGNWRLKHGETGIGSGIAVMGMSVNRISNNAITLMVDAEGLVTGTMYELGYSINSDGTENSLRIVADL